MNLLRNRAGATDAPTWLEIFDDDIEGWLASFDISPDAQKPPQPVRAEAAIAKLPDRRRRSG